MALLDLRNGVDPLRELTARLVASEERTDDGKELGVYFLPADSEFSALARFVEREVFLAWFGNDGETMDREYNPFEPASEFILCVDCQRLEPAGVIRLLVPNSVGLKTLLDVEREPSWGASEDDFLSYHRPTMGMAGVVDIATLAVRDDWAGVASTGLVSQSLYSGLYRWSIVHDVELLVGALDSVVFELLDALRIPVEPLCGLAAIEYLGSPSTLPVVISVPEARRRMRAEARVRAVLLGETVSEQFSMPTIDLRGNPLDPRDELFSAQDPARGTT